MRDFKRKVLWIFKYRAASWTILNRINAFQVDCFHRTLHIFWLKVITVFAFMLMNKYCLFEFFYSTFCFCQWNWPNISFWFIFRIFFQKPARLVIYNILQNLHGFVIISLNMYCAFSAVSCCKFWTGSKYKCTTWILYLLPFGKFNMYNMTVVWNVINTILLWLFETDIR